MTMVVAFSATPDRLYVHTYARSYVQSRDIIIHHLVTSPFKRKEQFQLFQNNHDKANGCSFTTLTEMKANWKNSNIQ